MHIYIKLYIVIGINIKYPNPSGYLVRNSPWMKTPMECGEKKGKKDICPKGTHGYMLCLCEFYTNFSLINQWVEL